MTDPAAAALETSEPDEEPTRLHVPISIRSASLALLAVLAAVYTLHWAADVFIPLLFGLMLTYALAPITDFLARWHVPRAISGAVVLIAVVGLTGWLGITLSGQASSLVETLPQAAQKVRIALREKPRAPPSAIEKVQKAATELERAAEESAKQPQPRQTGVTRVIVEKPHFNLQEYLWSGTLGLVALIGKTAMVILIAYFLLASGDTFRRKLVMLTGDTLSEKKITVQVLDEITGQIQRYLLVQVFTSAIVGVATWLAFLWIGLDNAAAWGVIAGVTNLIPYLGAAFVAGGATLVGFMQFGNLNMALAVGGASFAIHTVVGYLLTPWLTSRAGSMNAVAVFVGVLAFGWLWGIAGLLLGVPILTVVKAVCDRVEDLKPVGELLGH